MTSEFKTVGKVSDIPPGEGMAYAVEGRMIAVFNTGDGFHAIDDLCPHMGASLAAGGLDGTVVTCPWHAWRFDCLDGAWRDNPRLKIDRFEVRVQGDEIQVCPAPVKDPPAEEKAE